MNTDKPTLKGTSYFVLISVVISLLTYFTLGYFESPSLNIQLIRVSNTPLQKDEFFAPLKARLNALKSSEFYMLYLAALDSASDERGIGMQYVLSAELFGNSGGPFAPERFITIESFDGLKAQLENLALQLDSIQDDANRLTSKLTAVADIYDTRRNCELFFNKYRLVHRMSMIKKSVIDQGVNAQTYMTYARSQPSAIILARFLFVQRVEDLSQIVEILDTLQSKNRRPVGKFISTLIKRCVQSEVEFKTRLEQPEPVRLQSDIDALKDYSRELSTELKDFLSAVIRAQEEGIKEVVLSKPFVIQCFATNEGKNATSINPKGTLTIGYWFENPEIKSYLEVPVYLFDPSDTSLLLGDKSFTAIDGGAGRMLYFKTEPMSELSSQTRSDAAKGLTPDELFEKTKERELTAEIRCYDIEGDELRSGVESTYYLRTRD